MALRRAQGELRAGAEQALPLGSLLCVTPCVEPLVFASLGNMSRCVLCK